MDNYSVKALKVAKNLTNLLKKFCEFPPRVLIKIYVAVNRGNQAFTEMPLDFQ